MKATKTNTSDNYILHVYKKRNEEEKRIYSKINFQFKETFGDVTVNIDDIFTGNGTEELRNGKYFIFIKILGNINGKQAQQGLYFKNKEIRDNFLETEKRLKSLSINVKETIKVIKLQHGKPKNDYGLLSYMAGKI